MSPVPPFLSSHQAGLPQYLKVLGYGRFGDTQTTGQGAHAEITGQEEIDDPKTCLVCQGLEGLDKSVQIHIQLGIYLN
jgi:hypothetical protein